MWVLYLNCLIKCVSIIGITAPSGRRRGFSPDFLWASALGNWLGGLRVA
jgi:hypothetical protein